MSTEEAVCLNPDNLWQFQQISLFTDLTIFCHDGSVPAHKSMLASVINRLGVKLMEKVDGLVLPDISASEVELALQSIYMEGKIDTMLSLCSFLKIKSEHNTEANALVIQDKESEPIVGEESEKDVKNIKIETCNTFSNSAKVDEALSLKKPLTKKQLQRIQKLTCDQCEHVAKNTERLKKHKFHFHEKVGYRCEYCDFESVGRRNLENHERKGHPELKEINKLKKVSCDQCDFIAKRPERLPNHKRIVHGDKYPCDLCGTFYLNPDKLQVHKLYKHDDRVHKCEECDYQTKNKFSLMEHNRVKHTDQMFYCDQCDYGSKREAQTKRHIEVKHEGKRYYCEQCEYSTPYKSGLNRHLEMVHHGINYSCNYCEHKSSTRGNLKLHVDAKHLGIKYPCDKCDFNGSQPGTLKIHNQTKHSVLK